MNPDHRPHRPASLDEARDLLIAIAGPKLGDEKRTAWLARAARLAGLSTAEATGLFYRKRRRIEPEVLFRLRNVASRDGDGAAVVVSQGVVLPRFTDPARLIARQILVRSLWIDARGGLIPARAGLRPFAAHYLGLPNDPGDLVRAIAHNLGWVGVETWGDGTVGLWFDGARIDEHAAERAIHWLKEAGPPRVCVMQNLTDWTRSEVDEREAVRELSRAVEIARAVRARSTGAARTRQLPLDHVDTEPQSALLGAWASRRGVLTSDILEELERAQVLRGASIFAIDQNRLVATHLGEDLILSFRREDFLGRALSDQPISRDLKRFIAAQVITTASSRNASFERTDWTIEGRNVVFDAVRTPWTSHGWAGAPVSVVVTNIQIREVQHVYRGNKQF